MLTSLLKPKKKIQKSKVPKKNVSIVDRAQGNATHHQNLSLEELS